jgi:ArsR family transcriptional regulator
VRSAQSRVSAVFRALGDDTRLQILALLRRREICVCEFVELLGISQSAVSEHLRRLKEAGLVLDERRAMWVFYRLAEPLPAFVTAALDVAEVPAEVAARFEALRPVDVCCARAPRERPAAVRGPH